MQLLCDIANLIDEVPILAILGTQLVGGIEIRDAAELRVKESDRITSVVENLRRMGALVTEFPDGLRVERSDLNGAEIAVRGSDLRSVTAVCRREAR